MADSIMVMGLSLMLINSTIRWPLSASKDFYFRSTKKFSNALPMYRSGNIFMWFFLKVWTYLSFLEHPPARTTNRSRYIMQDIAPRFFYFLNHPISMPSFYFLIDKSDCLLSIFWKHIAFSMYCRCEPPLMDFMYFSREKHTNSDYNSLFLHFVLNSC